MALGSVQLKKINKSQALFTNDSSYQTNKNSGNIFFISNFNSSGRARKCFQEGKLSLKESSVS